MKAFNITGRMITFSRVVFYSNDPQLIQEQLLQLANKTPFLGVPLVLDSTVEQDLNQLIELLINLNLQPMAVLEGTLEEQARQLRLPVLSKDPQQKQLTPTPQEEAVPQSVTPPQPQTSFHHTMLRTGQCIIQESGDVIITAGMNSGSEIKAAGNIHIYGHARGRIYAGIKGNTTTRIFCHSLEAELVFIAGVYCLADDFPQEVFKKPTCISLTQDNTLKFELLDL